MGMNYLSLFSGIEAATVAWKPFRWHAVAFSEIEKFPCALLKHHYPDTPNYGDVTEFAKWPDHDAIDLIVGGSPCQSFSVAGLRRGLDDPRGNLTLTYLAVVERYKPCWVVWENVPGVLSDDRGRTFGAFLGILGQLGYGFAYRVLDAQFFGVPQRRRRVFVVGHLGDWRCVAAVLFERESLSWNPAPSREAREDIAPTISARTQGGGGLGTDFDCDGGLVADTVRSHPRPGSNSVGLITGAISSKWSKGTGGPAGDECYNLVTHALLADGFDAGEDGTGRGTPLVASFHPNDPGKHNDANTAPALRAGHNGGCYGSRAAIAFSCKDHGADMSEIAPSLRAMGHDGSHANAGGQVAIAFHENQRAEVTLNDTAGCLKVGGGKPGQGYPAVAHGISVRRLTPVECERLMGLPDNYTLIPYRGKPAADGPRYKALGNSFAVPVVRWIGERIQFVDSIVRKAA
jgi:DNA (cytosine-5)-methyltransferase 1